jgi:hypothetical protein
LAQAGVFPSFPEYLIMDLKRLFQLLIVGGTLVGVGESCGGGVSDTNNTAQNAVTRALPDGGTVTGIPQSDGGLDTSGGDGVGMW